MPMIAARSGCPRSDLRSARRSPGWARFLCDIEPGRGHRVTVAPEPGEGAPGVEPLHSVLSERLTRGLRDRSRREDRTPRGRAFRSIAIGWFRESRSEIRRRY